MRTATGISMGVHALLGVMVAVLGLHAAPLPPMDPPPPGIKVSMARLPAPPVAKPPPQPPKPAQAKPPAPTPPKPVVRRPEVKPITRASSTSALLVPSEPQPPPSAAQPAAASSPAPPAPAPMAGSGPVTPDGEWLARLRARIERGKRYPAQALRRREEGTVLIRFVVARDGTVLSSALARSSGSDILDREAVDLPGRAQPLPPMPDGMAGERMELTLPVGFLIR